MFDPVDFFYLARELHYSPIEPYTASSRTCISRAYYAAFLVAREKSGVPKKTFDVHKKVEKYFRDKGEIQTANKLSNLKQQRHKADYDLHETFSSRDTGNALRIAKQLLEGFGVELIARKSA